MHSSVQLSVVALGFAVGACDLAEPPAESTAQSAFSGCAIILCGENAATAGDGLLFDELDLFGRPNYAGVAMTGANLASGLPVQIKIMGDVLYAVDPTTSTQYAGGSLIHTEIHFVHVPTGQHFDIRVEDFAPQSVTYLSGAHDVIPVYAFKARLDATTNYTFDVCSNDTLAPDPTWSGLDHYALVYRGDRYDPGRKRLRPGNVSDGWSFIACNGSAASKMHLWRHTYAGGFDTVGSPAYMTTLDQRTALLKAITADYCGLGTPTFTVTGTPLAFATAMEPLAFPYPRPPGPMASLEALWGPDGAHCLDHPRRELAGITRSYVESACTRSFPQCAPPDTTAPPSGWWTSNHVVTANP